jgi:hypothetical protein
MHRPSPTDVAVPYVGTVVGAVVGAVVSAFVSEQSNEETRSRVSTRRQEIWPGRGCACRTLGARAVAIDDVESLASRHRGHSIFTLCTPVRLHSVYPPSATSCVGVLFQITPLFSLRSTPLCSPKPQLLLTHHRYASRTKPPVAGSSSSCFAITDLACSVSGFNTLATCAMHGIARCPPPLRVPLAARRPVRVPNLLDFAEPAQGKGSQRNTRAPGSHRGGRRRCKEAQSTGSRRRARSKDQGTRAHTPQGRIRPR